MIVRGYSPDGTLTPNDEARLRYALDDYAALLRPWAQAVGRYMFADVNRRNERAWRDVGKSMSRALAAEIASAPTGQVYKELMAKQVELITSLPTKAALRVHKLVNEARLESKRPEEVAQDILKTGHVTASRATLIARTEVSRAASNLTQARAQYIGSQGYIWRTSQDADVRPTHQAVANTYVPWDAPPKTDADLEPYHAGCGPNCRCYPDPILPDL